MGFFFQVFAEVEKHWTWLHSCILAWKPWVSRWKPKGLKNIFLSRETCCPGLRSVNYSLTSGWYTLLCGKLHSKLWWLFQEFIFLSLPVSFSSSLVYCPKRMASRKELMFAEPLHRLAVCCVPLWMEINLTFKYYYFRLQPRNLG